MTVTRYAAGTRDKGRWVEGASSQFTAAYSVQPLQPREMELLPENRRDKQAYWLYGDVELKTADPATGTNADKVTIDGEEYEVLMINPWQNNIINHYQIGVVKQ